MIPLSDTPSPRGFVPWVTLLWIGVTVVLFGWARWADAEPLAGFGRVPVSAAVTALFLHPSGLHLIVGAWTLWLFGRSVEHRIGRLGFGAAFAGLAALQATVGSVGAEGAIGALLGAYFVLFPHNRVTLLVMGLGRRHVSARAVLGALGVGGLVAWGAGALTGGVAVGAVVGALGAVGYARFGGGRRARAARTRLRTARDAAERTQAHVEIGEVLVLDDPARAFHHAVCALADLPSPETARRAREILRALRLHPRLAEAYRVWS